MKKITLYFSCIICVTTVFAQRNEDFFLGITLSDEKAKGTFLSDNELPYFVFEKDTIVKDKHLVIYEYYLDGPPESTIYLGVFDLLGFPISHCRLLDCELDCPDGYSLRVYDDIIEVTVKYVRISDEVFEKYYNKLSQIHKSMPFGQRSMVEGMADEDEKEIIEEKKYYRLGKNGLDEFLPQKNISLNRKYKRASLTILDEKEIQHLSKKELRLMRNEIFADYGYIFKSYELQDYFNQKKWYSPRIKLIPSLTIIEQINIKTIWSIEKALED